MKHPVKTTVLLIALFVIAQLVGLTLINFSIQSVDINIETGEVALNHTTTAIGERPDLAGIYSFLYLLFGILIGTILLLVLIRFRQVKIWKAWFLLAVFLAQSVAFGIFLPQVVALALALALAWIKIYRPNPWVHNITEIFMYAGIAVLLVPILDVTWTLVLLLAISIYDAWAVWKSKHMVKMAEFQKASSVFAGLMVPKKGEVKNDSTARTPAPGKKLRAVPESSGGHAILGGGDIAFPLLFAGVVMEGLLLAGTSRLEALLTSLLITLGATIALSVLFYISKKNRYYPAMPFITAGCLFGWVLTFLF
jgi:presenilin-like A22 family membrane protease